MKKVILTVIICLSVIFGVYLVKDTDLILNIVAGFYEPTEITENIQKGYYYNLLNSKQKGIYDSICSAALSKSDSAKFVNDVEKAVGLEDVEIAFSAMLNDNPSIFYIDTSYQILQRELVGVQMIEVQFKYTENNIEDKMTEIDQEAQRIIDLCIEDGMTDYEKEMAIYNYLADNVSYYEYGIIEDIPADKHMIYSTLVKKEAVCDGFSKAFKYILDKLNVETILVIGELNKVAHCWNLVKLGGYWYNVDVTSGRQKLAGQEEYSVTHVYCNTVDKDMVGYVRDTKFMVPSCNNLIYNYYEMEKLSISSTYNLENQLQRIIDSNRTNVLELKVNESAVSGQTLIDALFNIDFNGYRSSRVTQIEYNKTRDVYIFVQE